jgi:hypothetical protein
MRKGWSKSNPSGGWEVVSGEGWHEGRGAARRGAREGTEEMQQPANGVMHGGKVSHWTLTPRESSPLFDEFSAPYASAMPPTGCLGECRSLLGRRGTSIWSRREDEASSLAQRGRSGLIERIWRNRFMRVIPVADSSPRCSRTPAGVYARVSTAKHLPEILRVGWMGRNCPDSWTGASSKTTSVRQSARQPNGPPARHPGGSPPRHPAGRGWKAAFASEASISVAAIRPQHGPARPGRAAHPHPHPRTWSSMDGRFGTRTSGATPRIACRTSHGRSSREDSPTAALGGASRASLSSMQKRRELHSRHFSSPNTMNILFKNRHGFVSNVIMSLHRTWRS